MKINLNLGIAKAIVSDKITNEFISESKIDKSKKLVGSLVETIKKSPVLMTEYVVIDNIENKYIDNDIMATKFIDRNIAKFANFSIDEINEAHESLLDIVHYESVENISESKIELYNSIGILIEESNNPNSDINKLHSAYEKVLNYIKENVKEVEVENTFSLNENIDLDSVVEVASRMYNEKYSSLNENERKLINTIVYSSDEEKKELFENLKLSNIKSLESTNSNGVEDKINEAIDKLNKMVYSKNTTTKDILELTNLKENLS